MLGDVITSTGNVVMQKKIILWGSIASIVSAAIAAIALYAPSATQAGNQATTSAPQSPAVNVNTGNIIYNNSNSTGSAKRYVLRNSKAGVSLIVSEPIIDAATDTKKHVCMALAGTPVSVLDEKRESALVWRRVKIENGDCTGKTGWAAAENISFE
jgi:hypothetical protein